MKVIALAGDGSKFQQEISEGLESAGYEIEVFENSRALKESFQESLFAVLLVNPHVHQVRKTREALRDMGGWLSRTPLLVILSEEERLEDFETLKYSDDFVAPPASVRETLSRLHVLQVKRGGVDNAIVRGEVLINLDSHQVFLDGKPVDLTYKEFELLKTLAATPGRVYSRGELLERIWGYDYFGGTRTVDVHIRRVRAKIEGSCRYIETVHGVGYRFAS